MRTTIQAERLKALFRAYRDRNDAAFLRTAESIIHEELAANHYTSAADLQRALGESKETMTNGTKRSEMTALPLKDRRNGEDLLWFTETIQTPVVFFAPATERKISRILAEHRRGPLLRKHGFAPKSKLLFWGPPGCGKTLTAYHIAYELGLPLGVVRLNALISSFLGDTASHLQRIFARANTAPMVLLLDEADAIAKIRDDPNDVGELKRIVNSFLQALDSFSSSQSVLIAASNHQYLFDPALWRRFDDVIEFPLPEATQRQAFIKHLLSGVPFDGAVTAVAQKATSLSYAELQHVIIEALKTMLLDDRDRLTLKDILAELQSWKRSIQAARTRKGVRSK